MAAGAGSGANLDRNVDREAVCFTTTAGGDEVFHGTIRHDDSLTGQPGTEFGWALYDQSQTLVPANTPGLTFVDCSTCCTEVLGDGCWDDGTNSGRWSSLRAPNGTVTLVDVVTGDPVATANVVDCPTGEYRTSVRDLAPGANFTIPGGGTDLVAWSVIALADGVTVTVNTDTATLGDRQTIEASVLPDPTAVLIDAPQVVTPAGGTGTVARVVFQQRLP